MSDFMAQQVTVTSSKVKVVAAIPQSQQVLIANRDSTNSFFAGPANVTVTSGAEVKATQNYANAFVDIPPETEVWLVSQSGQTPRADVSQIIAD
jgi:hypothetical protein